MNALPTWLRFPLVTLLLFVAAAPAGAAAEAAEARADGNGAQARAAEVAAAPPRASVEVEPNDGPDDTVRQSALVDGSRVTGTLSAIDDYDTFRLMVGAGRPGRVEVTVTNTSAPSTGAVISAAIGDRTGEQDLATAGDEGLAPGQSAVVSATLAAGGAYRLSVGFTCESDEPTDCPTSPPGATWSLAVKARTGTLVPDADGSLGAAADAAAEAALDALIETTDDEGNPVSSSDGGRGPSLRSGAGAIPAACTAQGKAARSAVRKVATARRADRKRHTKTTKRKLRTARTSLTRANTTLADCKAVVANAAKAAEAALESDDSE